MSEYRELKTHVIESYPSHKKHEYSKHITKL